MIRIMLSHLHSEEYKRFAARLREVRVKAGLSQAGVARSLGKPQSFVAKCESGDRRVDVLEARRFARLYGITMADLLRDSPEVAS